MKHNKYNVSLQGSKKVPSGRPELVDFPSGQVAFPSHLPAAQGISQVLCQIYHQTSKLQYCAKVMQTSFAEIHGFSWLFEEKISNFRQKRIFNEKS